MITSKQKRLIRAGIRRARAKGLLIASNLWGVTRNDGKWKAKDGCVCAMGALLVDRKITYDFRRNEIQKILGCTEDECDAFVSAFDSKACDFETEDAATDLASWYQYGVKLREEILV